MQVPCKCEVHMVNRYFMDMMTSVLLNKDAFNPNNVAILALYKSQ